MRTPSCRLRVLISLIFCIFAPILFSCAPAAVRGNRFDEIASRDAAFTVSFPSAFEGGEYVTCSGVKTAEGVRLTVLSPERSAGLEVSLARTTADAAGGDACFLVTLSFPEDSSGKTPKEGAAEKAELSPEACRALTDVFSLLYGDFPMLPASVPSDGEALRVSAPLLPLRRAENGETLLVTAGGTLTLGEDGCPAGVLCADMAKSPRSVLFSEYRFLP